MAGALLVWTGGVAVADGTEQRRSTTAGAPADGPHGMPSDDIYPELQTDGERARPGRPAEPQSGASEGAQKAQKSIAHDFWFFDADVLLFNDDDGDGFFHGIDVLFDADTIYESADVYAALYLSFEGGPWNEYAVTDTFTIFGATSDDEYVVVTELLSGYPRGSYDLLIELYDAWSGEFLADLGPEDHPDLALLPLEDFERDDPRRNRHRHRGGGALDWRSLAFLVLLATVAARKRRAMSGRRLRD